MSPNSNPGRTVGLIYLVITIVGIFNLIYVPNKLLVNENAAATAANISAHESLFRLWIVTDLLSGVLLLVVVLALYRLFEGVDRNLAMVMVILGGVMPAMIYFLNIANPAAALILVRGADFLTVFDKPQREALALLFLQIRSQVIVGAETLWGLWLLPLAILTYRSRFLPRFLAVWLFVNGIAYVVMSFVGFLSPQYDDLLSKITFPATLGEVVFMFWLLIAGVDRTRSPASVEH